MPVEKYQNLTTKDFKQIKESLLDLKERNIYDYNNIRNYNKIFTCLYDKNEAIDFLFSKKNDEMTVLKIEYSQMIEY